jgi:hypothetical protein
MPATYLTWLVHLPRSRDTVASVGRSTSNPLESLGGARGSAWPVCGQAGGGGRGTAACPRKHFHESC